MARNKHLTLNERIIIQLRLEQNASFRKISKELDKSPTTITNEIKSHMVFKKTGSYGKSFCDCKLRLNCDHCFTCNNKSCTKTNRKTCAVCYKYCKFYEKETCPKLKKAPYVCNGCNTRMRCSLEKRLYQANTAQQEYDKLKSESRTGITLTEQELININSIIHNPIKNGQSLHHVYKNNIEKIMVCERSLYNYISNEYIDLCRLDLPRTSQRNNSRDPRKKGKVFKVDKKCRIGRTYEDFLNFIADNPNLPIVQMDSVIGRVGGKVLLTLHFVIPELMIGFIRDRNDAASVKDRIDVLYKKLGKEQFIKLIPVLLTDNGSEFSNPTVLEFDYLGNRRTNIFYCNPRAPYQKGAIENNHEFLRRILPKKTSFDALTQKDVNLVFSHINSYKRASLGDKSPYEIFKFLYGQEILDVFGLNYIQPQNIILHPKLLNK